MELRRIFPNKRTVYENNMYYANSHDDCEKHHLFLQKFELKEL